MKASTSPSSSRQLWRRLASQNPASCDVTSDTRTIVVKNWPLMMPASRVTVCPVLRAR
jgi:hypothetical protein